MWLLSQQVPQTHLMTSTGDWRRFCSYSGIACQVKTNRQSKPPIWGSPEFPKYWKVFQSITSITGHTTADGSSLILEKKWEKSCWHLPFSCWRFTDSICKTVVVLKDFRTSRPTDDKIPAEGVSNLWSRGSNQPSWHSQWQSRKVSTSPVVIDAPSNRARTSPSLLVARIRCTFLKPEMYLSSGSFRWASGNQVQQK